MELEVHFIDIEDIWYVGVENSREVVYYTKKGVFSQPTSFEQVHTVLKQFQFKRLDRGIAANIKKINHFDKKFGKIYFDNKIKEDSMYATVSYSKIGSIRSAMKEEKVSPKN